MPLPNAVQPQLIPIHGSLRLRKYDGRYELFLPGYQDPVVYQNSEGIFDERRIPDLDYVKRMCDFLSRTGELYYIEVWEAGAFVPVGDVTVKPVNPPIAIWDERYRGKGLGTQVMGAVTARLRELGFRKITGSTVYRWNLPSQKLHEKLGFRPISQDEQEILYELELDLPDFTAHM